MNRNLIMSVVPMPSATLARWLVDVAKRAGYDTAYSINDRAYLPTPTKEDTQAVWDLYNEEWHRIIKPKD